MSSFMGKLRVVTLGAVHDLLDKAIDMNSPSALRQYVRDLEDALDKMRNEAAVQAGGVRTLKRETEEIQKTIAKNKNHISTLLAEGKNDLARVTGQTVISLQKDVDRRTTDLENQEKSAQALDAAVEKLEEKHRQMVNQLRELERLDRDTKGKEQTAKALTAAESLLGNGADISVDDIAGKMRARNDVASEKFDRAMGSINESTAVDDETAADVDALLASLKPETAKTA